MAVEYGYPTSQTEGGWPDWTKGFKFPWETPTGQGFQAPWTSENPLAPKQAGEEGLFYGPYGDMGQIPPELLREWDVKPIETTLEGGGSVVEYYLVPKVTEGMSEYQKSQLELSWAKFEASQAGQGEGGIQTYPLPGGQASTTWDEGGNEWFWNEYSGRYEQTGRYNQDYDMGLRQQQATQGVSDPMSEWQQWQSEFLPWQAQQEYGLEQQQYAAQLATQPKSWLEYAAYTGQPPVVQPWMMPLMPQEYEGLEGLRAGQPVPGWPEQFTGTGGGFQPQDYTPFTPTGGAQPGGALPGGTQPGGATGQFGGVTGAGWQPMNVDQYLAAGLSPEEAEKSALHDLAYQDWKALPSGMGTPDKSIAYLQTGQIASQRPETQERYQTAIGNLQSGDPLLRDISSREKMQLVTQMINQGMDRTLAERQVFGGGMFGKYDPVSSYVDTTVPEVNRWLSAATTGESRTASYPEPTREPTKRIEEPTYSLRPSGSIEGIPKKKPAISLRPSGSPEGIPRYEQGTPYVPKDMTAQLHEGEAVIPADENTGWLGRLTQLSASPSGGGQQSWLGGNQMPMSGMPELVRPSRQYQARMGPTAMQQYGAYAQARTGITPEELQWRLMNRAPPGGGYSGLRWMR